MWQIWAGTGGGVGWHQEGSIPLCLSLCSQQESPEPLGLPVFLVCGMQVWDSLASVLAGARSSGAGQELQPQVCRDGGWSFEPNADFNLNHKSLDPAFIFEGRFYFCCCCFVYFFFNQAAT